MPVSLFTLNHNIMKKIILKLFFFVVYKNVELKDVFVSTLISVLTCITECEINCDCDIFHEIFRMNYSSNQEPIVMYTETNELNPREKTL